jgi:tetratricopeptide (TPR) repeat protein
MNNSGLAISRAVIRACERIPRLRSEIECVPEGRWICCARFNLLLTLLALTLVFAGCTPSPTPASSAASAPPAQVPNSNLDALAPSVRGRILELKSTLQSQPQSPAAWGQLGQAFHALELNAEARACYAEAARLDSASGRWPYLLGILQLLNDPDPALTNLARAVAILPATNDAPRLALGKALAERGRPADAAREFTQILSLQPAHPAARLELARLKLAASETAAAIELLQPCLTNPYTARPAHLLLSQAKLKLGDSAEAARLAQAAAPMPKPFDWPDPFLREVKASLALAQNFADDANRLLLRGRVAEAEKLLLDALKQDAADAEATLLLGRVRAQQDRFSEAEQMFLRHLAARPNSLQGWMQLGLARFRQKHFEAAAEAFKKATEIKPDYAEAHMNLGVAYSSLNKTTLAIAALQTAARCQPGDARAHSALAEEYLRAGQKTEAARAAAAALEINPQDARALRVRSVAP